MQLPRRSLALAGLFLFVAGAAPAQTVPDPLSHFGFEIGEDRRLANWSELTAYYGKVATASPRVTLDTLGPTTNGLPFVMLTITSPENHARLGRYLEIQRKLADPRQLSGPEELAQLLDEGRAVVLITAHIHSTEVGAGQMPVRLLHELATSSSPRVRQILDNVILLHIPSLNPDGTQMIAEWWRETVGTPHEGAGPPKLYHEYIGHDNNRDWYAFTQLETQHTVLKAHNVWRPHITHDVHQMGSAAARIFFPPYIDPIEPNVDPRLITALNQLGMYMAAELTGQGKKGVVVNAIYDGYTPARAYMHYHGGVRILSETASGNLAAPITITPEQLRPARNYHVGQASWNFPDPWPGGEWRLRDIIEYQKAGAMALLTNAAANRRFWLENFHNVNRSAVDRWPEWPHAWVIPANQQNTTGVQAVLRILRMGDVEVHTAVQPFTAAGRQFPSGSYVIPMNQPYASFAQTMLVPQEYPDMREYPGGPPARPYDVTAHALPLLMSIEAVAVEQPLTVRLSAQPIPRPDVRYTLPAGLTGARAPRIGMYRSYQEPMPAGWTRWVFDQHNLQYAQLENADFRRGDLASRYDVIVLQTQGSSSIINGSRNMPERYAGGIGQEGVEALRRFVEQGGRLVAIEDATEFAIETFGLKVSNPVAQLRNTDFYIPGSILKLNVDRTHPIARGVPAEGIAWYWTSSRPFDVADPGIRVIARYGEGDPLLAGWVLGGEHVAGKPAILEASVGQGSVVLFGFQPNYRAQTIATWPLLFNAMQVPRRAAVGTGPE